MPGPIACIAASLGESRRAAGAMSGRLPASAVHPFSLAGYLDDLEAPRRIVLCATGRSAAAGLDFLRRAGARLLWPAPSTDFRDAIEGIRHDRGAAPRRAGSRSRAPRAPGALAAALLMEGRIDAARAQAALRASAPREWIVESARHVRVGPRRLDAFRRAGVRWSSLDPVDLVAVYASPALARAKAKWSRLVPRQTRVWVAGPGGRPG